MSAKPPGVRLNQAILLLAGALFFVFVVAPEEWRLYWTFLTIGGLILALTTQAAGVLDDALTYARRSATHVTSLEPEGTYD